MVGGISPEIEAEMREERRRRRIADLYANDLQFRAAWPDPAVAEAAARPGLRLAPLLSTIMEGYANRPALGQRTRETVTDAATGWTVTRPSPSFTTITYGELWARVGAIAATWRQSIPVDPGDSVAIAGFASSEYLMLDMACAYLGLVSVPLQHNAPAAQLKSIVAEVEPRIVAASTDYLEAGVEAVLGSDSVRRLVVFDYRPDDDDHRRKLDTARARMILAGISLGPSGVLIDILSDTIEHGETLPPERLYDGDTIERPAMILYTSGSTGTPKGALYSERMVADMWALAPQSPTPVINVNFMPLNHLYGRSPLSSAFLSGGTSYFVPEADLSTLFEDWSLVRPTEMKLAPRVVEMLYQRYRDTVERWTAAGEDVAEAEVRAATDLREHLLGGRVLAGLVSSAPLTAEMAAFLDRALDVHFIDGYGLTEIGPVTEDTMVLRPPVTDYKLIDVPELGYFGTDRPYPRGELLVKTRRAMSGYHRRPELASSVFDEDGFYRTGDVVAEIQPDRLVYVERRSAVLKLANGEFVAVARLEAVYAGAPLVRQIFVYGNGLRNSLVAVIVPTPQALERYAGDRAALKSALAESLRQTAHQAELKSYEIPVDFLIEDEPFTTASGLLSGVGKLLRPKLKDHYGVRLEKLFADIDVARSEAQRALHRASGGPALEIVTRAAGTLVGAGDGDVSADARFIDLGGDSLTALRFSALLQDLVGVEVPVGLIINPASDLRALARHIEDQIASGTSGPTVRTVHGSGATLRASDLTLDNFIDVGTLLGAVSSLVAPPTRHAPGTVLLTGANGWLGRFLTLQWLERLSRTGGTLVALVRGRDIAEARGRLEKAFDSPDLRWRFRELASRHLEVVTGDIDQPGLGLDAPTWARLTEKVDLIVHAAALVNHVLPYGQLFGPNVAGTAEIIRMAITTRIKPVIYVSTSGVGRNVHEDSDIREISPVRTIDSTYANGYSTSKWAGEVLLREAHDLCGLPVTVFRPDAILAHPRYAGQLNVPDMFSRLMLSLIATGIAPGSFYDGAGAHFDGLPVDFVAETITSLGGTKGFRTVDLLNPHDDGASLDTFVDWLNKAGCSIVRIDDYAEWFARFETSLRALPEKVRQRSSLPLLQAYRRPQKARSGSGLPTAVPHVPRLTPGLIAKYVADLLPLAGVRLTQQRFGQTGGRGAEGPGFRPR